MPYWANAMLTEDSRVMVLPDRSRWIRHTQIVDDPEYLTQPWIVNYAFKKLSRRLDMESDTLLCQVERAEQAHQ